MGVKISYIMASYNHDAFVRAMVQSVLAQSVQDFELIVIDDGSTDSTPTILRECAQQSERIHLIEQENTGIVAARNRGLQLASGEYVSFIDSDDRLEPTRSERLIDLLDRHPQAVLAYGDAWIESAGRSRVSFWSRYPVVEGNVTEALLYGGCFIPAVGVMCRRSELLASGPLWGGGASTDYLKWLDMSLRGAVVRLDGPPVGVWCHHERNLSQAVDHRRVEQYTALASDLITFVHRHQIPEASSMMRAIRYRRAHCYAMAGYYSAMVGDPVLARGCFLKSIRETPNAKAIMGIAAMVPPISVVAGRIFRSIETRRNGS